VLLVRVASTGFLNIVGYFVVGYFVREHMVWFLALQIADFGLARTAQVDNHAGFMTEYVATRWYARQALTARVVNVCSEWFL
jgi:hypothetical protein